MSSDHLPILIGLQTTATSSLAQHRTYINLKMADWSRYMQESKLSSRHLPTDWQKVVPSYTIECCFPSSCLLARLSTMNDEITKATSDHKIRQWREFVESIDHRSDSTKLWMTIKGIDGKSKQTAENEGITFT